MEDDFTIFELRLLYYAQYKEHVTKKAGRLYFRRAIDYNNVNVIKKMEELLLLKKPLYKSDMTLYHFRSRIRNFFQKNNNMTSETRMSKIEWIKYAVHLEELLFKENQNK